MRTQTLAEYTKREDVDLLFTDVVFLNLTFGCAVKRKTDVSLITRCTQYSLSRVYTVFNKKLKTYK